MGGSSIECCEMLHGRRFSLRLKEDVHRSYARPAILYGSEAWCLKESEMEILGRTEIHGERNVWRTAQRSTDFMFMLGLSEAID